MRVVVAIFEQLVPISGGGTPRTSHIVRALVRRGHSVYAVASFGVSEAEAQAQLGCAGVLALPHVSRLDRRKMFKYLFVYPWNILRLALYVWQVKPDVVVSHNTVAGFGALLGKALHLQTKTVLDLTDLLFEYIESFRQVWMSPVSALGRALERHTIRHSDHVVTISQAMSDILVQSYDVDAARIRVVHDGVDCGLFCEQEATDLREKISPWARHVCVLHGVIDPQDGPELLVEAMPMVLKRFPQTAFWWVGDGSAVPGIRARAQTLGVLDKSYFSGWVSQQEVIRYLNASDLGLVVLPDILSARGRVTLKEFEYWACGKAAILPRLPALQEIIPEGEASLFYTPGDPQDLADKICSLLADDDRRRDLGQRGRRMASARFEWRVLAEQLAGLVESFVAGTGGIA